MTRFQIPVTEPFDFELCLAHLDGFAPCSDLHARTTSGVARAIDAHTWVEVSQSQRRALDIDAHGPTDPSVIGARVRAWLSTDDDMTDFYALAERDAEPYRQRVRALRGLHQVRFFTLAEATVWFVITQRTQRPVALRQRDALIERCGSTVESPHGRLPVFPFLDQLIALGADGLGATLRNNRKGAVLHDVVSGVAALGETYLREAPHGDARDALLAIRGVGPFTADALLLRALGRREETPIEMPSFAAQARALYGPSYDSTDIRRRYDGYLGWWAWHLKNAA